MLNLYDVLPEWIYVSSTF